MPNSVIPLGVIYAPLGIAADIHFVPLWVFVQQSSHECTGFFVSI